MSEVTRYAESPSWPLPPWEGRSRCDKWASSSPACVLCGCYADATTLGIRLCQHCRDDAAIAAIKGGWRRFPDG